MAVRGAAATALAALALVACGGEAEPPAPAPPGTGTAPGAARDPAPRGPRLTRPQFTRRVNAICARGEREARRLVGRRLGTTDPAELRRRPPSPQVRVRALTERALTALESQERLRAIRPPARIEDEWRRFLDRNERAVLQLPALARAVGEDDPILLRSVVGEYAEAAAETDAFVRRNGLGQCRPEAGDVPELEGLLPAPE